MSDVIKTDFHLSKECNEFAQEIVDQWKDENPDDILEEFNPHWEDMVCEYADGSQNVIYHYRALQICANCDTNNGEMFLDDVGMPENPTLYNIASLTVYGEMRARIIDAIREIISNK